MSSSSTGKSSKNKSQDIAWEHGKALDGYPNGAECNYCGQQIKSGGVTRLKEHLAGGYKNVRNCPKVPPEVRKLIKRVLVQGVSFRESKKQHERNISEKLYGFSNMVDVDDEEDEEENDGDMRRAMYASRAEQWEKEQMIRLEENRSMFHGSIREVGGGSRGGGSGGGAKSGIMGYFGRSKSMKMAEPKLYGQVGGVQKKIKEMFNKGRDSVGQLGKFGSKFFFYNAIPAHAADTVAFKNFVAVAQREGEHVKPPQEEKSMGSI